MQKHISAADPTPLRVVVVTLDRHLTGTMARALPDLKRDIPGLSLSLHAAAEWGENPKALEECKADIATGDIIIVTMLFIEEHVQAVMADLEARREACDAMVCCMSAGEVVRLTRMGKLRMGERQSGAIGLLKRLRGSKEKTSSSGAHQMALLRRLPKILRFIPGTAQDLRAYFLTMQYWLACSDENLGSMVRFLADRYAAPERQKAFVDLKPSEPVDYPDVGVYHPRIKGQISERIGRLPRARKGQKGTVGLLVMRSYVLAGDTAHYDGVIAALEARDIRVIPAFASGLDSRPALDAFFTKDGKTTIDALVSLTGFSLVGGPAYNDAKAAADALAALDVPYLAAHAVEFQSLEQWQANDGGLLPVEATMMVAIPELDGSTGPMLFGGRSSAVGAGTAMQSHPERADRLAGRVARLIRLRSTPRGERKVGIVLFNFPPNAGSVGTAAYLSVFASLHKTLTTLHEAGYDVEVPATVDALRDRILHGNATRFGAQANVHHRIPADDHVRRERWLDEIEAQWGPAPGKHQSDGASIFVLGETFGNVFVGVQPAFGYEGDPMRLLFEKGFAPTHAFSAFYRYLNEDFGADAVLHFGTHGALEFMPGKQVALGSECWPDRLIGNMPNLYLYAANNPSEGLIAKRRSAATLLSYLTPPITEAGLYRGLIDLKASLERWRALPPEAQGEREQMAPLLQAQAAELDIAEESPPWGTPAMNDEVAKVISALHELEYSLIPHGLHVIGEAMTRSERVDMLLAMAEASDENTPDRAAIEAIVGGASPEVAARTSSTKIAKADQELLASLAATDTLLAQNDETSAVLHALDGRFVRPAPSGDLIRTPDILPTGRNLHGFDPFRLPSAFAMEDGARQADRLLERHAADGNSLPESIALVLWGSDNLKSEGGPIAQALALMGAKPRFDSFGRLCGAALVSLEDLGRPRIDVMMTLSGIFRDLLPLQIRMLAEASYLAASADEPLEENFVRKHALAYQEANDTDLETAALRVFSNADGAYGSNVNQLIDSGCWQDEDELAETYSRRKCFAYGRSGKAARQAALHNAILGDVDLAYQNLESVELGVTTVDHYFDTLGGISRSVRRAKGDEVPVYIGDQTRGQGKVRTLTEQVALETRTRALNPKWYEGMLEHGYEGVRQIEAHVTNTMGWSATTGQVAPWVYQQLTQTFVLDEEMRERLASLNPTASAKVANRLLEAHERDYWSPDPSVLEALREAGEELEDRVEGIEVEAAA